jgi:hypothetical protein
MAGSFCREAALISRLSAPFIGTIDGPSVPPLRIVAGFSRTNFPSASVAL